MKTNKQLLLNVLIVFVVMVVILILGDFIALKGAMTVYDVLDNVEYCLCWAVAFIVGYKNCADDLGKK